MNPATTTILARLQAARPALRNAARAWLARYLGSGRASSTVQLADALGGRSRDRATVWLSELASLGLLLRPAVPAHGWESARPACGVQYGPLFDALGHQLEDSTRHCGVNPHVAPQVECRECGMPREATKKTCRLCPKLKRRPPGWLDRLVAMAARAERRERLDAPGLPPVGEFPAGAALAEEDDGEAA